MNTNVKVKVTFGKMSMNVLAYLLIERLLIDARRQNLSEDIDSFESACDILWNNLTEQEMEELNSRIGAINEKKVA